MRQMVGHVAPGVSLSDNHEVAGNPAHFVTELKKLKVPKFMLKHAFMREFADDQAQDDVYDYFI